MSGLDHPSVPDKSRAYFMLEMSRFREVMCTTRYTAEQKERAFSAIFLLYLNCEDLKFCDEIAIVALSDELQRRLQYERLHPRKTA